MSIITDTKATLERIRGYGNEMKGLLSRREVHSIDDLKRVAKESSFQSDVAALWGSIVRSEGGAITMTVVLSTIAIAMGGVGIAAGGGAIGLPLLVILAPAGYLMLRDTRRRPLTGSRNFFTRQQTRRLSQFR
jgi:hypothetical protein